MPEYDWKNEKTGDIQTTDHHATPPDDSGEWKRVYSFGLGSIMGAGGSPSRPSTGGGNGKAT